MPSNQNTIQQLINHFQNKLQQLNRSDHNARAGKQPRFPMLVVCLGGDAMCSGRDVADSLFRIWPQYRKELHFLGIERTGEGISYFHLEAAEDGYGWTELSVTQVKDSILSQIFGLRSNFRDKNKLCLYYLLDTTGFASHEEYDAWVACIGQIKRDLGVGALEILDMLVLLLNESFSKAAIAGRIRSRVAAHYNEAENRFCESILLLSNKRKDNTLLEEWSICCRIISSVIALSNNDDSRITANLFSPRVFTVSYAYKEKPSLEIGQVVVEALIDNLSGLIDSQGGGAPIKDLLADSNLPARLGITPDGTLSILDEYVVETLVPRLPSPEQLEYFPRRDSADCGPLCELTASEFNALTMNAWDCYLSRLSKDMRLNGWGGRYTQLLNENFYTDELISLSDALETVRRILSGAGGRVHDLRVLDSAAAELKHKLASDPAVIDELAEAVKVQGDRARAFVQKRTELFLTRKDLFPVTDGTIRKFYQGRLQNYFVRSEDRLRERLRGIRDIDSLFRFLEEIIDEIIVSDEIFQAPFEREFEIRLHATNQPYDAQQYIRQQLTVDDVYTYLQVNFSLDEKLLSAILLNVATPLYGNLCKNLNSTIYYYNTGYSNIAESIEVYEVGVNNLL